MDADNQALIAAATRELLSQLLQINDLQPNQLISAIFTITPDLKTAQITSVALQLGWSDVPLLCASEIDVPGSLRRCIRVLLHVQGGPRPLKPVYLHEAKSLRPDLHS